ncbi:MAG: hypothetical protein GY778_29310 [bacterium]|nr:hypothetical protein [bacterium]
MGRPRFSRKMLLCGGVVAVLTVFAALFVIWDLAEQHLFANLSTGLRHALLTLQAGLVTGMAGAVVYLVMRRQHQQLSRTAQQLTELLGSYRANPTDPGRFENPHLVHCRQVKDCDRIDCPAFEATDDRCWQLVALGSASNSRHESPAAVLQRCHECEVYRRSCPDKLTELGESFNNLMFLLEEEAKQLGQMRAQMVEKEKMSAIGQMASGIAHEVGNPLSSISSVVQMLKRNGAAPPPAEQLELIDTHIRRISTTVRQLVRLSRPSTERWEPVDLTETLKEVVQLVLFDRRAREVEIDFDPPKSLPTTHALPGQLQQVFINLALNALDAMGGSGALTIRARHHRRSIIVSLTDTGCGIDGDVGRRVFEPFFTTKEPGRGTGLGLAVSYGIIQKHGGTIDFSSAAGEGTVFTVTLPVLDRAPDNENGISHRTAGR